MRLDAVEIAVGRPTSRLNQAQALTNPLPFYRIASCTVRSTATLESRQAAIVVAADVSSGLVCTIRSESSCLPSEAGSSIVPPLGICDFHDMIGFESCRLGTVTKLLKARSDTTTTHAR